MEIRNEVQNEIDNFRENYLPCKKSRICLPQYIVYEKIRHSNYDEKKARWLFGKGASLYRKINDKRKKHFVGRLYNVINEDMKAVLYRGESIIKPECENHDCPIYSTIRVMDGGEEFNEFITAQMAAMYVYKWKESERVQHDLGEKAIMLWGQQKTNVDGKETTLAAEFRKDYNKEMIKEIEEFGKNHPRVSKEFFKRVKEKIVSVFKS
jgi:hypothetical protein